jgi:Arc/MetJ-type ribon-helix-helix transcriptional regulator
MARSKPTARDALRKLREQRVQLEKEEARLREEAAAELGKLLIECGAETIEPAQLRQIIRGAMALGIEETLKRIAPA